MTPEAAEVVRDGITRYGLTAIPLAARRLGVHPRVAGRVLEGLVRDGALVRHEWNGAHYFTAEHKPLPRQALRRLFAISWHCHMTNPPAEVVPTSVVADILATVLPHLGVAALADAPMCLTPQSGRLGRIVLGIERADERRSHLQDDLAHLQRTVAAPAFRPWLYLAGVGLCEIVYLHPRRDEVDELRRWITMHPLCGVVDPTADPGAHPADATTVPVRVAPLVELGSPKRQQLREELLSPTARRTTV